MDGGKVRFIALNPDQSLGRAYKKRVNADGIGMRMRARRLVGQGAAAREGNRGESKRQTKAKQKGAHGWHARLFYRLETP
ncbi:hypothetical protein [Paraburkholderia tropica]|uniref:hypothetical protein n=1 Tax=Paraburkholderia tropica TaxID=92647 RepID=UPI003D2AD13E